MNCWTALKMYLAITRKIPLRVKICQTFVFIDGH
jgi:hypothetical protein